MNNTQILNKEIKSLFGLVLLMCLLLSVFPKTVSAEAVDTWNPEGNSYVISTPADLNAFRSSISTTNTYEGKTVTLANDINIESSQTWTALVKNSKFQGILDGKGYTIKGFNDGNKDNRGLIFGIGSQGQVINLNLDLNVQSGSMTGGITNNLDGVIDSCKVSGTIVSDQAIGGMVSQVTATGTLKNCSSSVNITNSASKEVAGIARIISGTVQNCYVAGALNSTTVYAVGRLNAVTATNCYYTNTISVADTSKEAGTAKTETELKTQSTYTGWDFATVWQIDSDVNNGYPTLRQGNVASVKQTVQLKAIIQVDDKVVPLEGTASLTSPPSDRMKYLEPTFTVKLVPIDTKFDAGIIDTYHVKLEKINPDTYTAVNVFTGQEVKNMVLDAGKITSMISTFNMKLVNDPNDLYNFEVFNATSGSLLAYEANTPSFTFNGDTTPPTAEEKAQILAATEASINSQLAEKLPADTKPTILDSWLFFTAARAGYKSYDGLYDDCYKLYEAKYQTATSYAGDDVAKDVLAITAMGFDPRNVAGKNLVDIMQNNGGTSWFTKQVVNFAINSYDYSPGSDKAYIHELAAKAVENSGGDNGTGSPDGGIDMYVMYFQPMAAYYNPNATKDDEFYDVRVAMETVFFPYFSTMQGYTGDFYSGMVYANPWSTAQAHIMLGMSKTDIFASQYIKNGNTLLSDLGGNTGFGSDVSQCARGYVAMVRAAKGENQLFDCTDVLNSTVRVNNAITALPEADAITDENKDDAQTALDEVDSLLKSLTLSDTQKNSIDKTKYDAVKAKLAGSDTDMAKAKTVIDQITAMSDTDKLTLVDKEKVTKARADYKALTEAQKKLVTNLDVLEAAEAKIVELEAATGSEADKAEAKKVSDLIDGIKTVDQLKAGDKAEVMKSRKAFKALTDIQKALVSEEAQQKLIDAEAKIAELEKKVEPVKSETGKIEVAGLPETVKKLKVEDKKDDPDVTAAAKKAAEEAKIAEVEVVILYGIKPDMTETELEQFNNDASSYVTMTLVIPEDKRGAESYRIYHKKTNGDIEWIDPMLSEDDTSLIFKVSSFSDFGVMAKTDTTGETEDEKAAKTVVDQIAALPAVGDLVLTNKTEVTAAREAYTALTESQKILVTNLATLTTAEAKIVELETAASSEVDKAAAKTVVDQITALPAVNSLVLTDKTKVTAARSAYTALTEIQKGLVTNLATLSAAETKITELEKTETDKAAAKKVTDQIAALGTITKWEQKASIDSARTEYNKLTDAQKSLVTIDTLNSLKAAEAAVEKFKPTTGTITIDVERFTIGQGFFVEPVIVSIEEGETARQALEKLLGIDNLIGEINYLRAVKGADTGTAAIPDYIVTKLGGGNSTTANAYSQEYSGTTLGEFDYSKYSGWYYLVNNSAPNVGINAYTLKEGDVIRLAFTYWGYGTDVTGLDYKGNVKVAIANKDSLLKAIAAVNANKTAYLSNETIKSAYNAAMSVVQDMTATQKATNDAATALNKAVADSSGTDKAAAKIVVDKITALPVVGKLVLTDKAAVTAARIAYDALTTTQKALVTNLETLTAAEAKIAELEKEAANTANKAAAKAVSDKIAALHSGTALLLGEKADVLAARIAYDALTDTQKDLVTNLSTLVAAEARIAELEKEKPVAKDEKTGIEAVGLPAGTAIKVGDESNDTAKTGEAVKAAEKKGIKNAKIVSLYDIKPDLSEADLEKFNNDKTSYVTLTLPLSGDQQGYDSYMVYHKKSDGTIEWITPTQSADKKSLIFKVNAFSEFGVVGTKTSSDTDTGNVSCTYQTQIENVGWQTEKSNGATSGTEGQSLRLEGIKINVAAAGKDLGVEYQTHVQNIGWQGFKSNGTLSGTEGKSLRLEGIQIRLTGKDADKYDIYYRVHAQNYGWLDWAKNGENAGTEGFGYRLEGIEIKVVEKNATAPGETDQPFITGNIHINYQTQIQNVGWQELKKDGTISGTSGQSLRLEGIKINVENTGYDVGVSYQTHVENIGWQDLRTNGKMSGTEGESKRLEGIKISLTGNDADLCDVYYQVHAQNTGWMNWAKNGESAGTEGFGYRLEGIRIMVVPKGSPAPSTEAGTVETAFLSNN